MNMTVVDEEGIGHAITRRSMRNSQGRTICGELFAYTTQGVATWTSMNGGEITRLVVQAQEPVTCLLCLGLS